MANNGGIIGVINIPTQQNGPTTSFTSSGTYTASPTASTVNYLIAAGGGSGGGADEISGAGGAGGLLTGTSPVSGGIALCCNCRRWWFFEFLEFNINNWRWSRRSN
jgi:hypothetical protein